jgi:DNA invertase Pin-like site-specific DNA recombinase
MSIDLIAKAKAGDLTCMNFAILARLSDESKFRRHELKKKSGKKTAKGAKNAARPMTGLDINNRDEQVTRCTERIEHAGGNVVFVYHEPHTSAWKRKRIRLDDGTVIYRVIRPVYKQALADLAKGKVAETGERLDGLMILDVDRLTRDNRDLEDAIDVVVYRRRPILDWRNSIDLLTESGRTNARGIVAYKNAQSTDTAWRVANKHKALQREGIPAGGPRPFGWKKDRRTLHPVEAPLLKTAALDVLAGKTLHSVVVGWADRGILTANGKKWRREALLSVLRNPRICGYRMATVHEVNQETGDDFTRRVVALNDKGKPIKGQWERIITPKEWRALIELLGESYRRGNGHNARVYLLSGTLRCGKDGCDEKLRAVKAPASRSKGKPEGFFWYGCPSKAQGGCGGVRIDGPAADEYVTKLVIAKYEQQTAKRKATKAPAVWDKQSQLDRVHEDMTALKAARRADPPKISAERYYAELSELEALESALVRESNAFTRRQYASAGTRVDLRADWTGLTLAEKHAHIERMLTAVTVMPVPKGRRSVPASERLIPTPVPDAIDA